MKKEDYLHLYLGCWINVYNDITKEYSIDRKMTPSDLNLILSYNKKVNIHLRPLSDMTEEEMKDVSDMRGIKKAHFKKGFYDSTGVKQILVTYWDMKAQQEQEVAIQLVRLSPEIFHYLLSKGFDLFGLIESGLAIDKTKLISDTDDKRSVATKG